MSHCYSLQLQFYLEVQPFGIRLLVYTRGSQPVDRDPDNNKMHQLSLSNNTMQRRISKMSIDVKEQVLTEIKASSRE